MVKNFKNIYFFKIAIGSYHVISKMFFDVFSEIYLLKIFRYTVMFIMVIICNYTI